MKAPYFVRAAETTPDEPQAGWYYPAGDDQAVGPFNTRTDAEQAMDPIAFDTAMADRAEAAEALAELLEI